MSEENYGEVPFDDENAIDDMNLAIGGMLAEKSTEDIEAESNFNIPAGIYHAYISKITPQKNAETGMFDHFIRAYVDVGGGNYEETSMLCKKLEVDFALMTNEEGVEPHTIVKGDGNKQTIRAYFTAPPDNPEEMHAYEHGCSDPEKPRGAGFFAKQLKQMISHLGFGDGQGGITPDANNPRKWKAWDDGTPRFIKFEVELGAKRTDKKTGRTTQYSQIKMFSYADSELNESDKIPAEFRKEQAAPPVQSRPAQSAKPVQAAQAPARPQSPSGQPQRPTQATQTPSRPVTNVQRPAPPRPGTQTAATGAKKPVSYDV